PSLRNIQTVYDRTLSAVPFQSSGRSPWSMHSSLHPADVGKIARILREYCAFRMMDRKESRCGLSDTKFPSHHSLTRVLLGKRALSICFLVYPVDDVISAGMSRLNASVSTIGTLTCQICLL